MHESWIYSLIEYNSCYIFENSSGRFRRFYLEGIPLPILNIVLVEPQIPQNTGNIARTCAVTGARLHLVKPLGFSIDDKKLKRAGLDYWHYLDITDYDSLEDFFSRNPGAQCFYFSTKAQNCYSDVQYPENCYLFFGREDAGLPEELLVQHPQDCVRIPMRGPLRSLNLSNSVAIGVYEALRQWGFPELQNQGKLTRYAWEAHDPSKQLKD